MKSTTLFQNSHNLEVGYDHENGSTYIPSTNTNCSNRLRAAYNFSKSSPDRTTSAIANKRRRANKRRKLLDSIFVDCPKAPEQYRREFCPLTFFDGSNKPSEPTTKRPSFIPQEKWTTSVSIAGGDMFIVDNSVGNKGFQYPMPKKNPYQCPPTFAMPPRQKVLDITKLGDQEHAKLLFDCAQQVEKLQSVSTKRHCHVLGDDNPKQTYVGCFGVLPNRKAPGVSTSAVTRKTNQEVSDVLNLHAKAMERIFKMYGHPYAVDIAYSSSQLILIMRPLKIVTFSVAWQ